MFEMMEIKLTIYSIIENITNNKYSLTSENEREALHYIISNSIMATNFVILIEDEFNIEFDDDEVDFDFFSSIDRIVELVRIHYKGNI